MGNNQLIKITTNEEGQQLASARELHEFLESKERFSKWWSKVSSKEDYGFEKGVDYTPYQMVHPQNNQEITDYIVTIDMGKEISMISRLPKGKEARQYFIACEKKLKEIQSKAQLLLDIYNGGQAAVIASKKLTEIEVKEATKPLVDTIEELTPQAVIGDKFTNSDNAYDMNLFSKALAIKGLGRNNLFAYLRNKEILRHNNEPYQKVMEYFKIVVTDDGKGHINSKTLVKSKGISFIVKKLIKDGYIIVKSIDEILEELNNNSDK